MYHEMKNSLELSGAYSAGYSAPIPQLFNAITFGHCVSNLWLIKPFFKAPRNGWDFFESQRKGVFLMTLCSEVCSETEKLRTMMDTQTFIRDDHLGPEVSELVKRTAELKQNSASTV